MKRSSFVEKLNKVDGNVYVIEELVQITDGVYEGELQHDNVNTATFAVYTGPKLTGDRIESYVLSTPSMTPWKKVLRVYADAPEVFISYETEGDTVEAEDVNRVQDAVVETQDALNSEAERATAAEAGLAQRLAEEEARAKEEELRVDGKVDLERERALAAEQFLQDGLTAEEERAVKAEQTLQGKLDDEISRAQTREMEISSELSDERARAQSAEKVLTDQLSAEITRAKAAEKANSDAVAAETGRAEAKEIELQGNIDAHKAEVDGEIQSLKAADIALDEKKADAAEVNRELGNRYTKNQVFTKEEVLQKIEDLIGTAPDTLDTFKEIADALGNDPNFAATIMNALAGKVDKVTGKQLSSNDYSDSEKAIVADVNEKKHTHGNKAVVDKITQALLDHWSAAYAHVSDAVKHITTAERENWNDADSKKHTHSNKSILDDVSQVQLDKWNTAYGHLSKLDNPHQVTKSQVGLGSVPNVATNDQTPTFTEASGLSGLVSGEKLTISLGKTAKAVFEFISHKADAAVHLTAAERTRWDAVTNKVDKVSGKGLSANDYTTAEKNKLSGIASGAEVNVQSDWNATDVNGGAYIKNKPSSLPANGGDADTAVKLKVARTINGVEFDGTQNITVMADTPIKRLTTESLNDVNTFGDYYAEGGNAVSDKPAEMDNFGLHVQRLAGGHIGQEITADSRKWERVYKSDIQTWTDWVEFFSENHLPEWGEIAGKPATFAPSSHVHTKSQISDMPTKLSQFTNDPGYITQADVDVSQNHTHANKTVLDKVTQAMLDKLAGIADGANKYIHPNSGATAGTYRSVTVNGQGHITAGSNPTTLSGYGITDAAAKSHNHDSTYLKKGAVTWNDLKGGA